MPGRLNDGSGAAPRLRPTHAMWALIGLPRDGAEWTLDEKFRRVAEAGFEAVECWPDAANGEEIANTLQKHSLRLGYGYRVNDISGLRAAVKHAQSLGADYLNCQAMHSFMNDDENEATVRDILRVSEDTGVPIFIETHRATLTENLFRVWEIIRRVPDSRFCADISHYAVGSEYSGMTAERLAPVLERTSSIHARVGNGQQVQTHVFDPAEAPARDFVKMWGIAMRHWKAAAQPGDILPFVSELGPPGYAQVDLEGREISDRWEQSLMMRRLGELAWNG